LSVWGSCVICVWVYEENGIVPTSIHKVIHDLTEGFSQKAVAEMQGEYKVKDKGDIPQNELRQIIHEMEKQMKVAVKNLKFEHIAALRDEIFDLKSLMAEGENLKPWEWIKLMTEDE